ncbi:hypothetical protein [Galbibacter pacificus]|uniref:Uncharacterized protein n=1 Tax=Galbibacter pacificus TaxID=2996052 RepID=A0ABT6FMK7_9FLAO|nr:hypothetical protein [Galbibacter pacificus]MDG3581002.1 hypothetical protein [Galbibacter pacificus]MDG3584480.1 hypothetical protein [Galbibacter pacificus]
MKTEFIELSLGSHVISHGFDALNKEITEEVNVKGFSIKVVAISRIKSLSEKYILTDYLDGRWIYWEYESDFEELKKQLL